MTRNAPRLDRLLAWLSPAWSARRLAARKQLEELRREAARPRRRDIWKAWSDPDAAGSSTCPEDLGTTLARMARERGRR